MLIKTRARALTATATALKTSAVFRNRTLWAVIMAQAVLGSACGSNEQAFDAASPARGPSEMLGDPKPATQGKFDAADEAVPEARQTDGTVATVCDDACRSYCDGLQLKNPVDVGLCSSTWGRGQSATPIVETESCRRLFADTLGYMPSLEETQQRCTGRPWSDVVNEVINSEEFVRVNRRLWADRLRYDTQALNVERIFDMDRIVQATYEGKLAYDQFAAVVSAHPVVTRRYDTDADRAESMFLTFLGRPPFGDERSDFGRLYHVWRNQYYDHPQLGTRVPDAYVGFPCLNSEGVPDATRRGECTSATFGEEEVIFTPDTRAVQLDNQLMLWSGFLSADEWERLQIPGRLLAKQWLFWEHAVNLVVQQYFGYNLTTLAPETGEQLVRFLLDNEGDIRALHYALLTSVAYRQSSAGTGEPAQRYLYGPLKQTEAESWVDSLNRATERPASRCDLRINRPRDFLEEANPYGIAMIEQSDWQLDDDRQDIRRGYVDLVRTLGGCPDNSQGGRFKIVSVLTTANQLNFADRLCSPGGKEDNKQAASVNSLLPGGDPKAALTEDAAADIIAFQTAKFFGRSPTEQELQQAHEHGKACAATRCSQEDFARPVCFALLSSAEMLFY